MLGGFMDKLKNAGKQYSGQKDFLEAVCAGSALIAAADGEIEDSEIDGTLKALMANATLSQAFNSREIEACVNDMMQRVQSGRTGRMGLMREIEDVAADPDKAEAVLLAMIDVSESDGEIEPEEQKVLENISSKLRLDLKKYMEV